MGKPAVLNLIRKIIQWLLLAVTVLFLITGFGISQFRVVETITLGWLSKSWAFRLHDNLWIPFVILIALHVLLPLVFKKRRVKEVEL
jgi:cytochrome b subunit of formate dehydrogenase